MLFRSVQLLTRPEMRDRLLALGADPVANSPREFAAFIKSENEKWGRVIRQAKIQTE